MESIFLLLMPAGVLMSRFFEPCKKVNGRLRPSIAWPEKTATKIIVRFNHSEKNCFPAQAHLQTEQHCSSQHKRTCFPDVN